MILVTAVRLPALLTLWLTMLSGAGVAQQDSPPGPPKQPDTFFAGSVTEITPAKLSVSRKVSGKTENRSFRITPDTKVEGKLKMKVRVTVRYATDDDGATAMLIVAGHW